MKRRPFSDRYNIVCNFSLFCLTWRTPEEYAKRLLEFIKDYTWLYTPKNIRFFVDNLWSSVPSEWHTPLMNLKLTEYLDIYNAIKVFCWKEPQIQE
jgi:hypothetical protein